MGKKIKFRSVLYLTVALCSLSFNSCSKHDEKVGISVEDISQTRAATGSTMKFRVILSAPSSREVSVSYTFQEGSAKKNTDFTAGDGILVIPANQKESTIDVIIPGDPLDVRQPNLLFTVTLSKPVSCSITKSTATGTIVTENGSYLATGNTGYTTPLTYPGMTLVWSDEFSGNVLDISNWNYEVGNGSGGWGNNELESYSSNSKNSFLSNGNLIIEARREAVGNFNYSSARITTQGKKEFKFGRIDIRAKLPVSSGIWPALWMLGANISSAGWPVCGETDIMELIGKEPSTVYGTLHWGNTAHLHVSKGSSYKLTGTDYSNEFHVFSLVWGQDYLQWFVDDNKYLDLSVSDVGADVYPFNAKQFFIFNVAVGGAWPGSPDNTATFPQRMFIDYVRVFQ